MKRLMAIPFGPVLLVAFLPYAQWRLFAGLHPLSEAHRPALILSISLFVAMCFARVVFGNWLKSGLTGVIIAIAITALMRGVIPFLSLAIVALVLLPVFIERKLDNEKAIVGINVFVLVMLGFLFFQFLQYMHKPKIIETSAAPIGLVSLKERPSIVHIVMDGYGSPFILKNLYGHDTAPFRTALAQRGFVIMRETRSPFNQTLPIMASIMSGAEVILPEGGMKASHYRQNLAHTVQNGPVPKLLKRAGYTFASVRSGYSYLSFPAEIQLNGSTLDMTGLEASMMPSSDYDIKVQNRILKAALTPGSLQKIPQPFFYFQHLLAPHPPFTLNADGSERHSISTSISDGSHFVGGFDERRAEYMAGYREKALFIENALLRQVDALPKGPKVIIIHGDHGPGAYHDYESAANSCMAERMTTFMAVYSNIPYVTAKFENIKEEPFNLVNVYRVIVSSISNSDVKMLPGSAKFLKWSDPGSATDVLPEMLQLPCLLESKI